MKRIIFVGICNKPDTKPLCSSTKSGKLIDRIIKKLPDGIEVVKTNLFDVDYPPKANSKVEAELKRDFSLRIQPTLDDIVVFLGVYTHAHYPRYINARIVRIGHPAAVLSNVKKDIYVATALVLINNKLNTKTNKKQ